MDPTHLPLRIRLFLRGARARGFVRVVGGRVSRVFLDASIWALCLPITLILHSLGYRRLTVITCKIGHLAAEIDCHLKAKSLHELPRGRYFVLAPPDDVANAHLLDYWRPHVPVISNRWACVLLRGMSRYGLMRFDVGHYVLRINHSQDMYRLNALWPPRPPILTLTDDDEAWSRVALSELGVPLGAWFVCVHIREPGFSPGDDASNVHRNADPASLVRAIEHIVAHGGWCIRMGDPTMTALPALPNVIDYTRHPMRSARLDVVLCAKCRFFLGNTSGLALVSTVFGVPSALVNMIPTSTLAPLRGDLSIPKLIYSQRQRRLLRFAEIFSQPAANYRYAPLYSADGLEARENDAEDILEIAREMLERLDGTYMPSEDDLALQAAYIRLFRPGHYSYGAASAVGAGFLRRHRALLETPQ